MSHQVGFWTIIFVAAVVTYALRIAPIFIAKIKPIEGKGKIIKFLEYASASIIGSIIFMLAFDDMGIRAFIQTFDLLSVIKLSVLALSVVVTALWGNVLYSFLICMIVYAIAVLFIN